MNEVISAKKRVLVWMRGHINWIILALMIIVGLCVSENFFTWDNIMNLFRRVAVNGITAVGFTIIMMVGGFDLSLGGTLALSGCLCIGVELATGNAVLALLTALAAGLAVGAFNGVLLRVTRGSSGECYIITLATNLIVTSIAFLYCGGSDIYGVKAEWYQAIGQGNIGSLMIPISGIIWIAFMIAGQFLLRKTKLGRQMLLTGSNKDAAYLAGIDVGKIKMLGLMLGAFCAAVGGIVLSSRTTGAAFNSGVDAGFDAAVASIVGGNSIAGGKGGMVQVFVGVMIYGLITNILNLLDVQTVYQYVVRGAVLLTVICLDTLNRK